MFETLKREWQAQIAILLFILLSLWWYINGNIIGYDSKRFFGDFPSIYGVMALWGAIWGILIAHKWGGLKSVMGKAILMFSLGLFAQEFGQLAYAYLSFFLNIEVPYPSIGDIGYFGSIPLYLYGVYLLAKASGIKFAFAKMTNVAIAIVIPLIMLSLSYFLFLQNYEFDWSMPLVIFLDFGYPMGQAIYISLALLTFLLSQRVLGGIMRDKIFFILFALLLQYASDYVFLFQAHNGTWSAGGVNDYMYLVSYLFMTLGILQLETTIKKLRE